LPTFHRHGQAVKGNIFCRRFELSLSPHLQGQPVQEELNYRRL